MSTFTLQEIANGFSVLQELIMTPSADNWANARVLIAILVIISYFPLILISKGRVREVLIGILVGGIIGAQLWAVFSILPFFGMFFGIPYVMSLIAPFLILLIIMGLVVRYFRSIYPYFTITACTCIVLILSYYPYSLFLRPVILKHSFAQNIPIYAGAETLKEGMTGGDLLPPDTYYFSYKVDRSTPIDQIQKFYASQMQQRGWTQKNSKPGQEGYVKGKRQLSFYFSCYSSKETDRRTRDDLCSTADKEEYYLEVSLLYKPGY